MILVIFTLYNATYCVTCHAQLFIFSDFNYESIADDCNYSLGLAQLLENWKKSVTSLEFVVSTLLFLT